ncbi:hypothetical protein ACFL20_03290 [Spirochaetota bacterium]
MNKTFIFLIIILCQFCFQCKTEKCISGDCYNGYGEKTISEIGTGRSCSDGIYIGYFKNGEYNGYGNIKCYNFEYSGQWKDGLKHGKGIIKLDDGTVHIGTWEKGWECNGLKGNVNIEWKDGTKYTGNYKNIGPIGIGKIKLLNGKVIKGTIKQNGYYKILNKKTGYEQNHDKYYLKTKKGQVFNFYYDYTLQYSSNYFVWLDKNGKILSGPP